MEVAKMAKTDFVLQHETRRMIYNHIVQYPGVTFAVLKNVFGLSDGTLRYHIDYLIRAGKIRNGIGGGRRAYFPASADDIITKIVDGKPTTLRLNRVQAKIVNLIKKNPGINQEQLSKAANLNRNKLRKNISALMDQGIVKKRTLSNIVSYEYISNGEMQFEILKTMLKKLINGEIDEATFLEVKRQIEGRKQEGLEEDL